MTRTKLATKIVRLLNEDDPNLNCRVDAFHPTVVHVEDEEGRIFTFDVTRTFGPYDND
jgi:hypothetical protein